MPLIWYSLDNLVKLGFKEAIVLVNDAVKSEVAGIPDNWPRACPIHQLTDLHRIHRSAFTALFFKDKPIDTKKLPGPKSKHKKERDIIGLDKSHHNQICFLSSEADLEENLTLKRSLLRNILELKGMSTVKGELFPHLVKKQFSSKTFVTVKKEDNMLFDENLNKPTGISNYIQTDDMILQAQSLSNWNDNLGDLSNAYRDRGLRCYAHVKLAETFNIPSDTRKDKGTTRPTIGEGCFIGSAEKVKLTDCVVMDGVSVQEGSNIQGSIICDNVTIEPKCDIQDCIIGSGYTIQTGKRKNEVIQEIDKMMEI
ncbi:EIF2B3 [Lepeophtheirus salmonis]|uniref:EIF2B3 n=1 Tax=Lepeophtheirus salmonis TaxID=72036 RepID=A0A7R8D3L5_LEPSM|nr:EIF2B3 [Lepeophtheirus salmonis]CAF2984648.1 EIF2B3 [Lepeophtheirus salmonis]